MCSSDLAQVGAGAIVGRVTDAQGGAVPGASVSLVLTATNRSRLVVSGTDGGYVVAGLAPGTYDVRVELAGFRPVTRAGVVVSTGDQARVDVQLQAGAVSETVTVTGDASLLRAGSASLGQVIDNQRITELPLNGRSFIQLAGLVPGVALPPNSSLPRINGGRPRTNEYLFDGISVDRKSTRLNSSH